MLLITIFMELRCGSQKKPNVGR